MRKIRVDDRAWLSQNRRMNLTSIEGGRHRDYARIERAIRFIVVHHTERPDLDRLAEVAGVSKYHFDRMFHRWAGVSPLRFVQLVALTRGKRLLAEGRSVLDASLDLGFSGPSRLHDLFVTLDAVTPGDFKGRGEGLRIRYGLHDSPFGRCLVGLTERGICWLSFVDEGQGGDGLSELRQSYPEAKLKKEEEATCEIVRRVFDPDGRADRTSLRLHVCATNFQAKVWAALVQVPPGAVVTYGELARILGQPGASRAVGSAVAANPVSVLIPCHRVIRETGSIGEYRWGSERKQALLAWEAARRQPQSAVETSR